MNLGGTIIMYSNPTFYHHHPYYDESLQNNTQLANDIQKAINGEYSAIACYEKIAQMAPTQSVRDKILEIRHNEVGHYEAFRRIYTNLTGKQPTAQITEQCPPTYREGLDSAFRDEQE